MGDLLPFPGSNFSGQNYETEDDIFNSLPESLAERHLRFMKLLGFEPVVYLTPEEIIDAIAGLVDENGEPIL